MFEGESLRLALERHGQWLRFGVGDHVTCRLVDGYQESIWAEGHVVALWCPNPGRGEYYDFDSSCWRERVSSDRRLFFHNKNLHRTVELP